MEYQEVRLPEKGQRNVIFNALCGAARVYAVTTWRMERERKVAVMTREEIDAWDKEEDLLLVPVMMKEGQDSTNGSFINIREIQVDEVSAVSFILRGKSDEAVRALAEMGMRDPAHVSMGDEYGTSDAIIFRLKKDGGGEKTFNNAIRATGVLMQYFQEARGVIPVIPIPRKEHNIVWTWKPEIWTENDPTILSSIYDVCGLKAQKAADWNAQNEYYPVPEHIIFKDWQKFYTDRIVKMCGDDGKMVIFDRGTCKIGMWAGNVESYIVQKYLHPVMQPAPTPIETIFKTDDINPDMYLEKDAELPPQQWIPTGISLIDKTCGGLPQGMVTILTAAEGGGKSTLLNTVICNLIQNGYKAILASLELNWRAVYGDLYTVAAGPDNVVPNPQNKNLSMAKSEVKPKITAWLRNAFTLYNNASGSDVDNFIAKVKDICIKTGIHVLIVDNLMMLNCALARDELQKQRYIAQRLKEFAEQLGVAVILVCHARKTYAGGSTLIKNADISGASELKNIAAVVISTYKIDDDFTTSYARAYNKNKDQTPKEFITEKFGAATNALCISKVRQGKMRGEVWGGLYYQRESTRMLNEQGQQIRYGWEPSNTMSVTAKQII